MQSTWPSMLSTNNVNNIIGENYDERESGTDKSSWIQVIKEKKKKPQEDKIILR
jgi:hypothetical protein